MNIERYVLIDREGNSLSDEYDNFEQAKMDAKERGFAVEALIFEYSDSELVWTPNGSDTWPPKKRKRTD